MVVRICTIANIGLEAYDVIVEADSNKALPTIEIIGLPDVSVKEAKERIKGTFRHSDLSIPKNKIILNLAPSDLKKTGTRYDLPMAVAILYLGYEKNIIRHDFADAVFLGELGLDGTIKKVNGILPSVLSAIRRGKKIFVIPTENSYELSSIEGITTYAFSHFIDLAQTLFGTKNPTPIPYREISVGSIPTQHTHDFGNIKGHQMLKRALSIAVSGRHNVLLIGSPGCGKTMLAKAIQSILPPLPPELILEVSQIYSLVGKLNQDTPLITTRPFRQVHHTASKISIVGGGKSLTPGEVTLAHQGVLFFDELAEFPREVLEVLRQPIEDKTIAISRVSGSVSYPANIMFVATMNPCKCGYYKDSEKNCTCSPLEIARYQKTISGPLLDRIDMILEVPRENINIILDTTQHESSADILPRVIYARERQSKRYEKTNITANADVHGADINTYIPLGESQKDFLTKASHRLHLSPRVLHRIIKLARTIADMDGSDHIEIGHLAESLQYRNKTLFVEE